jgi:hypothetical protein
MIIIIIVDRSHDHFESMLEFFTAAAAGADRKRFYVKRLSTLSKCSGGVVADQ